MSPQPTKATANYVSDYDAVLRTMQGYVDGITQGKSALMRPSFHPAAGFFGPHPQFGPYPAGVAAGSIDELYELIDQNGPAPQTQIRYADVRILGNIAYVHAEIEGFSGSLAGSDVKMSDVFTLMMTDDGWKIVTKAFHWHMQ